MQPDLNKMMQSMAKLQKDMERIQTELASAKFDGSAGGGVVTVTCNGSLEFTAVKIKKEAVDPEDVETLEDLVLMAIKDATSRATATIKEKMGRSMGGMGLPPGLGM